MTVDTSDLVELAASCPRPGWSILDAARNSGFTGELMIGTTPTASVYLDRGQIYLAERVNDPALGARLVDAGALNPAQLELGALQIAGQEHLGRLFERVPGLDRDAVLVTSELMTEECIGWIASQQVGSFEISPYCHHPSGVHRWVRSSAVADLAPGSPLPAPQPTEAPVEIVPPTELPAPPAPPAFSEDPDDAVIEWDQPSWLDTRLPAEPADRRAGDTEPAAAAATPRVAPSGGDQLRSADGLGIRPDWIDRLETDGLPAVADPLAAPAPLPPVATAPVERFEVIWPSGEVDEQFGGTDIAELDRDPDLDRAGPTARLVRGVTTPGASDPASSETSTLDIDALDISDLAEIVGDAPVDAESDDVVLAVRRAVASIETGSLDARRRIAEGPGDVDTSRGTDIVPPGRIAVREEPPVVAERDWAAGGLAGVGGAAVQHRTRSVFDEVAPASATVSEPVEESEPDVEDTRKGALRRLIGALRRR